MFKLKLSTVLQLLALAVIGSHYATRKVIEIGMSEALTDETLERIISESEEHKANLYK